MIYKAISGGDFNTVAIWQYWDGTEWVNASVKPSVDDDVYTNGFIVTITTSQAVENYFRSSLANPAISEGGQFQIGGSNDIVMEGDIWGSDVNQTLNNPLSACVQCLATHMGKLSIIGNQNGGSGNYASGFYNASSATFESIIGNQNGGSVGSSYGFYNAGSATFESIIGNQNGGSVSSYGFYNVSSATFESIIGNQNGGGGGSSYGFLNAGSATFESIIGNQTGGSGGGSYGFRNTGSATFEAITGSQLPTTQFAFSNTASNITINFVNSEAYTSTVSAIYNTAETTIINFSGKTYNNLQTGIMAIRSDGNVNFDLSVFHIGLTPTLTEIALYPASTLENPPLEKDVRDGKVYGIANNYTGSLKVASPATILKGVPTDDTVGEWQFDDDLIERLKHCATTEIVDVQLASYQNT